MPNEWQAIGYVVLAGALGGLVGFEREAQHKPAGLRTHVLVAGAASLIVLLGRYAAVQGEGTADPTRALHGVVTGIGFIGAGVILRGGSHQVKGLTTAASLFFVAAVGAGVALEQLVLSTGATVFAVLVLWIPRLAALVGLGRSDERPRPTTEPDR